MSKNFDIMSSPHRQTPGTYRQFNPEIAGPAVRTLPGPGLVEGEQNEWLLGLRHILRHWGLAAGFAIVVSLLVTVVVLLITPVYEPTARLEIAPPGNESFSLNPGSQSDSAAYAETEAKKMQTDELALAVIRKVHLRDPQFNFAPAGEEVDGGEPGPGEMLYEMTPAQQRTLKAFKRALAVQVDSSSWLITVSFAAPNAARAALITNTVVDQFIEMNYKSRHDAIGQSTLWLSRQLDDIRSRMDESRQALADFQKSTGITPVNNGQSSFDERVSELNKQVTAAQSERIQLEAMLHNVSGTGPESLPQISADSVVQELSKKLASTRADLRQVLVVYGPNHPKSKELNAEINELEAQIHNQEGHIYSSLKTSYAAARAREGLLDTQLKGADKAMGLASQYETFKKEAQANEDLYNALYTKVKEAGIAAESKSSNINVVDRARVLDRPTRPNRALDILIGVLTGIFGGILIACVRGAVDTRIHTIEDMKDLTELGSGSMVPVIGSESENSYHGLRWITKRKEAEEGTPIFLLDRPLSAESEALLALGTNVRLSQPTQPPRVLLIASAMAAEGKSTIAANLAVALARHGSTCLVNADLRKHTVSSIFGITSQLGLSEVLTGACSLEEALLYSPDNRNLASLSSGNIGKNGGELVCSQQMREVLNRLRQWFKFVVLDSAPLLPYADARAMSTFVDGVILVGRSGITTRESMKRSLELLRQAHSAPLVDVVLNGVKFTSGQYRQYYDQRYTQKA